MNRHVAFLRGVNVGGHGIVKMEDLRAVFEAAGAVDVNTYIQSGNVIFTADDKRLPAIAKRAASGFVKFLGEPPAIAFRTLRELAALVERSPFGTLDAGPDVKLYVAFGVDALRVKSTSRPRSERDGLEVVAVREREIFVVSRRVKGRFGIPNAFIEAAIGEAATTRNWNTVTKIVDKFS